MDNFWGLNEGAKQLPDCSSRYVPGGALKHYFLHTPQLAMLLLLSSPSVPLNKSPSAFRTIEDFPNHKKFIAQCCSSCHLEDKREQNGNDENLKRRSLLILLVSSGLYPILPLAAKTKSKNPYNERRLLEQNRRVQKENNVPDNFPSFVREGFEVKVVAPDNYIKRDSRLIFRDFEVGQGDCPKAGQQVTFHYVGYNESGRRIDSSYQQGTPAKIRMGTNALVPGFEEGISDMKPGGKRRIIIPPELGPPVGPSTFFSSKQFEVFDVELLGIKDCQRRTIGFYSDVVCD